MTAQIDIPLYRGRFAPSPTGPLHFGSLTAAVASFLDARAHQGRWLVRMEDLDPPRERAGAADQILRTLEAFGMEWDEPVLYQSTRTETYAAAVDDLLQRGFAYPCDCSRKDIALVASQGIEGPIYPGTCRNKSPGSLASPSAMRLKTRDEIVGFHDAVQGDYAQNLASDVGDFVIRRVDGLAAYQLAVVLDDAHSGITHVVRGADLLPSTPRQIFLQRLLGCDRPDYAHIPLVTDSAGRKLSKSDDDHPVDAGYPLESLSSVMGFLGQQKPEAEGLQDFWRQAIEFWDPDRIPQPSKVQANTK